MLKKIRRIDFNTEGITYEGYIMSKSLISQTGDIAYVVLGHSHAENGKYLT